TVLRHLSVEPQFGGNIGYTGLVFDGSGNLLVGTSLGLVMRLNPNFDPAISLPTLTGIVAAAMDGTAKNAAAPSANTGEFITLTGTNFNAGTQVIFQSRDSTGAISPMAVTPSL